jgi:two-component system, NarL family, nitrate/nitrite response regulator NarL
MRLIHAGARGVFLKTGETSSLLTCLRAVGFGRLWMEECMLRPRITNPHPFPLTRREQEVCDLLQQGLANKEIALEMGIALGTVKIHLKHIFEKTGIRGRHSVVPASMLGDQALVQTTAA